MKKNVTQLLFAVLLFAFLPQISKAQWINKTNNFTDESHTAVCIDGSDQIYPITTTSTNDSSYFVAWMDNRNGDWDIYAQKYNSAGVAQWATNGVPVVTGLKNQQYYLGGVGVSSYQTQFYSLMASDNAGGFYITFQDDSVPGNTTRYRVGVQHVLVNGNVAFGSTGNIVAAPNVFNTTSTCKNPQLIADGHNGFFLAYEAITNSSSYINWGCYKDVGGNLKCYGTDVANVDRITRYTESPCGGYTSWVDVDNQAVVNYNIWSDNQGGCSMAFALGNSNGKVGYNRLARVKKSCTIAKKNPYNNNEIVYINYTKDSVVQMYNFTGRSFRQECLLLNGGGLIIINSTAVQTNGYTLVDQSSQSFSNIFSFAKGANLITKGTNIIGNNIVSTDVIAYYKRGIAGNTTLPPVLYTKNFLNEVYDSIPYLLNTDTGNGFIVKPATLPKMVVKTNADIGDTAIGQPYNTSISDFTMQSAGNALFIATKSPTASANAIVLQKLKLLPDAFYTDSFSVKRVTNNKNGVVVATDITSYPIRTYTYPSIAVGKNGSALLCYTENNGFMRVSALSDSCKILWGPNGYALGTGYLNGNLYNAKYPTVTIGSNNKTALVTWQDSYRIGNTGENIYARNIDSLPNNLPECVNGLLPLPSITGASGVCAGQQLQLANAVPTGLWSSSSNSININAGTGLIDATGAAVGNHTINYVVSGAACSGTVSKTIYVSASPTISAISGASSICNFNTPIQYSVSSNTSGTWAVNNNLANVTNNALNNYYTNLTGLNSGFVNLSYTATNAAGCSKTVAKLISISPVVMGNITGANSVCVNSTIQLQNAAPNGVWSSIAGRATINASGLVTGTSAGTAIIRYTVSNAGNCSNYVESNVTVNALPTTPNINYALGTINPLGIGGYCTNKTFTLRGTPSGGVWSRSGTSSLTINATTGVVYTGTTIGTASVMYIITNAAGCSNSRTINSNIVTCASKQSTANSQQPIANELSIYPNPAHSIVTLKGNNLKGTETVVVADVYGKTVYQSTVYSQQSTFDCSKFAKGVYFVTVVTNEGRKTEKLIVE